MILGCPFCAVVPDIYTPRSRKRLVNRTFKKTSQAAATLSLVTALLAAASSTAFAAPDGQGATPASSAHAADSWRDTAVRFADAHWNWTAWNDPTPVPNGTLQPKYQCAEFVARSLASAGLIPGLGDDAPQDTYYHYKAPNGKEYDLLLISDVQGYYSLYDFLKDFGLGADIGNQPNQAQPGDVVVAFNKNGTQKLHTGLIAEATKNKQEPMVVAHNKARYRYGYSNYDAMGQAHILRIKPSALVGMKPAQQTADSPNLTRSNADRAPAL